LNLILDLNYEKDKNHYGQGAHITKVGGGFVYEISGVDYKVAKSAKEYYKKLAMDLDIPFLYIVDGEKGYWKNFYFSFKKIKSSKFESLI
jgi:hypothetical protein